MRGVAPHRSQVTSWAYDLSAVTAPTAATVYDPWCPKSTLCEAIRHHSVLVPPTGPRVLPMLVTRRNGRDNVRDRSGCGREGVPVFRISNFAELVAAQEESFTSLKLDDTASQAPGVAEWLNVPSPTPPTGQPVGRRAGWVPMTNVGDDGSSGGTVGGEGVEDVF